MAIKLCALWAAGPSEIKSNYNQRPIYPKITFSEQSTTKKFFFYLLAFLLLAFLFCTVVWLNDHLSSNIALLMVIVQVILYTSFTNINFENYK